MGHLSHIHYFIDLIVLKNSGKYFVNLLFRTRLERNFNEFNYRIWRGKKKILPQYHIRIQLRGTSLAYNEKKRVSGKSK